MDSAALLANELARLRYEVLSRNFDRAAVEAMPPEDAFLSIPAVQLEGLLEAGECSGPFLGTLHTPLKDDVDKWRGDKYLSWLSSDGPLAMATRKPELAALVAKARATELHIPFLSYESIARRLPGVGGGFTGGDLRDAAAPRRIDAATARGSSAADAMRTLEEVDPADTLDALLTQLSASSGPRRPPTDASGGDSSHAASGRSIGSGSSVGVGVGGGAGREGPATGNQYPSLDSGYDGMSRPCRVPIPDPTAGESAWSGASAKRDFTTNSSSMRDASGSSSSGVRPVAPGSDHTMDLINSHVFRGLSGNGSGGLGGASRPSPQPQPTAAARPPGPVSNTSNPYTDADRGASSWPPAKRRREEMDDDTGASGTVSGGASGGMPVAPGFLTGRQQLKIDAAKNPRLAGAAGAGGGGGGGGAYAPPQRSVDGDGDVPMGGSGGGGGVYGSAPKYSEAPGAKKGGAGLRRFKPPTKVGEDGTASTSGTSGGGGGKAPSGGSSGKPGGGEGSEGGPTGSKSKILAEYGDDLPEVLRNCEPRLIEMIENEIMDCGDVITFNDIAGLEQAKAVMVEAVVWPMQMPELFQGLTRQAKGVLLFGPPGTGKTLIGKAVAHECGATFFSISASSMTSKWIGESEKLVRTLFAVAAVKQPSVIFIDEIDSLLTQRSDGEHESTRRVKTEFLVQLDGAATKTTDFVLVIGATNRPQELDEAARRRFTKRVYVPLPDETSRRALIYRLLLKERHSLSNADIETAVAMSAGYSGADVTQVCREAAMGALRSGLSMLVASGRKMLSMSDVRKDDLPPITLPNFATAFESVKPTVAEKELAHYIKWNTEFGAEASKSALETLNLMRDKSGGADSTHRPTGEARDDDDDVTT